MAPRALSIAISSNFSEVRVALKDYLNKNKLEQSNESLTKSIKDIFSTQTFITLDVLLNSSQLFLKGLDKIDIQTFE